MAVAAIGAWRRGRLIGHANFVQNQQRKELEAKGLRNELAKAQQKMADAIMAKYDADGSGSICEAELKPLLGDYSVQAYGVELQPSDNDVQFLFHLYEKRDKIPSETGRSFDRQEILRVCDAWGEFLKKKDMVTKLFAAHDEDKSGTFDLQEMQAVLDVVKLELEIPVTEVPTQVAEWIFKEADVTCNGVISELEMARALCACELWAGRKVDYRYARPDALLKNVTGEQALPKAQPASQCCVIC
jgi:Ca2+-binding EF-hand superfamily protein